MLSIAAQGEKKTLIVYKANLNFKIANKYLDLLIKCGLMSISNFSPDNKSIFYKTTDEGMKFLNLYKKIRKINPV